MTLKAIDDVSEQLKKDPVKRKMKNQENMK